MGNKTPPLLLYNTGKCETPARSPLMSCSVSCKNLQMKQNTQCEVLGKFLEQLEKWEG